jgi:hypothetical protein
LKKLMKEFNVANRTKTEGGILLKARGEEFLKCVDLLVEAEERKENEENDIRIIDLPELP